MSSAATRNPAKSFASRVLGFGIILLMIASIPLLLVLVVFYVLWLGLFHLIVWVRWPAMVVFVYSDSPKWKGHVEEQILPALPPSAAVLNWSKRKQWSRKSVAVHAFKLFAGNNAYCPIALVFRRGRWVRAYRFFKPFQAAKHGDPRALVALEAELIQSLGGVL